MTLVCAARKRDKNGAKSAGNGRAKERTIDLLDLGMEHKMNSLRIC